jgi:deoxyribodipyrimidine photo-lyase
VAETLAELRDGTGRLGQPLIVRVGTVIETLAALKRRGHLDALWSHEETGNDWTYRRDKAVATWCREAGVPWHEFQNHGVIRQLKSRNGWANRWDAQMVQPTISPPQLTPLGLELGALPSSRDLGLQETLCSGRQAGGRKVALEVLSSFLNKCGKHYQRLMSSPSDGASACSRLSPYLAWGAVSVREVAQATEGARRALPQRQRTGRNRYGLSPPVCTGTAISFKSWKTNPKSSFAICTRCMTTCAQRCQKRKFYMRGRQAKPATLFWMPACGL